MLVRRKAVRLRSSRVHAHICCTEKVRIPAPPTLHPHSVVHAIYTPGAKSASKLNHLRVLEWVVYADRIRMGTEEAKAPHGKVQAGWGLLMLAEASVVGRMGAV